MTIYTSGRPVASEVLAVSQPIIMNNFNYLPLMLNKDHNFSNNSASTTDGYHKTVHLINNGAPPVAVANVGGLYSTSTATVGGGQQLWYLGPGGTNTQLTIAAITNNIANGSANMCDGVIVQWGQKAVIVGQTAVLFNIAFAAAAYSVVATGVRVSTSNVDSVYVNSQTTTGFNIVNTSSSVTLVNWMAIGTA